MLNNLLLETTCGWCQSQDFCAEGTHKKATSAIIKTINR